LTERLYNFINQLFIAISVDRKYFLARSFLFQTDRFSGADLRGEENFFIGVAVGVAHGCDKLLIQLKHFGRCLNAFGITFTLGSIDSDFHVTSVVFRLRESRLLSAVQSPSATR